MPIERTLVLIKPDGVMMGVSGEIRQRYKQAGLKIVASKAPLYFSFEEAGVFYQEHKGKFFFSGLILALASSECEVLILEGEDAIARVRALHGATDPAKAENGTIRHDFRSAGGPFNTVHSSDSQEAFMREYELISSMVDTFY